MIVPPGFCNFSDIYADAVAKAPDHGARFVEIGSLWGQSATIMAQHILNSGKRIEFYCIDTWNMTVSDPSQYGTPDHGCDPTYIFTPDPDAAFLHFLQYMVRNELLGTVIPLKADSTKTASIFPDAHFDFVFIDADHSYEGVKRDILAWLPKIKPTGIIAGHDYDWTGVAQAVNELFAGRVIGRGTSWVIPPKN